MAPRITFETLRPDVPRLFHFERRLFSVYHVLHMCMFISCVDRNCRRCVAIGGTRISYLVYPILLSSCSLDIVSVI